MIFTLDLFVLVSVLVWGSTFGYLLALRWLAFLRRHPAPAGGLELPEIAIVVPTLNESALIEDKLRDLVAIDYPPERVSVVVVDGGSTDGTPALIERRIERDGRVRLLHAPRAGGRIGQIREALRDLTEEIVVVTDVDARLDPRCVRELVTVLSANPSVGLVGAEVRPASVLLEERIHWWLLNYLWWLEGEALSAAMFSGVCCALRRSRALALLEQPEEIVHLALAAGACGIGVRICPRAQVTEVRVPQTPRELLRFRRLRGAAYVGWLRRTPHTAAASSGFRLARGLRLWHFLVTPWLVGLGTMLGVALLFSPHWIAPLSVGLLFAGSLGSLLLAARPVLGDRPRSWLRVGFAASRLGGLLWWALLGLGRDARVELRVGKP